MPGGITFSDSTDQGGVHFLLKYIILLESCMLMSTYCSLENEIKFRKKGINAIRNTRERHFG